MKGTDINPILHLTLLLVNLLHDCAQIMTRYDCLKTRRTRKSWGWRFMVTGAMHLWLCVTEESSLILISYLVVFTGLFIKNKKLTDSKESPKVYFCNVYIPTVYDFVC